MSFCLCARVVNVVCMCVGLFAHGYSRAAGSLREIPKDGSGADAGGSRGSVVPRGPRKRMVAISTVKSRADWPCKQLSESQEG